MRRLCAFAGEKRDPRKMRTSPSFMADAKWCGHDSRGNPTIRRKNASGEILLLDDLPLDR